MQLNRLERTQIKRLLLERHTDWAGVHRALAPTGHSISQSTLERFFNGRSNSARTLRHLALLLNTTSEALLARARQATVDDIQPKRGIAKHVAHLRNPEAYRVAYQLWVELTTRKVGLPIDLAHDLVNEIYDSWYAFFREARGLIKMIPLHRNPSCRQMRQLVRVSQAVLNDGLRPHLEKWQGKFRHWHKIGGDPAQSPGLSPQQAQALFPDWIELSADLLAANRKLCGYLATLEEMLGYPRAAMVNGSDAKRVKRRRSVQH